MIDWLEKRWGRGPAVVEALVDDKEPPMPPTITRDQAMHFVPSPKASRSFCGSPKLP